MSAKTPPVSTARDIFLAALEKSTPEREGFLATACEGNAGLRRKVEELLREHEEVGSFLETPAINAAPDLTRTVALEGTGLLATTIEKPGDRIGRYKLLEKIGEGGCGVVYMAEQEEPVRRRVALKIIKLGMDTRSVIARFEAERQALAMMDHPNIAKVLDGGATETGRPYFVMELVRGVRITEYCDQNNVRPRERLKLFIDVCLALQHAHQKGIIHRDIKPSNILVTLHDGRPVPKVIDFGIAKATEQRLTDKTLFTAFTMFIGTPAYMSPEQAEMSGLDIDTRSDVYSLGVLLYELLTSKTPFDAEKLMESGLDECRRTIREEDPLPPSTRLTRELVAVDVSRRASFASDQDKIGADSRRRLRMKDLIHELRGDLDWVVMKCLEKDRARRYATANDLALDVQRYLNSEAVLARPPSNVYLLEKFVQRHRGVFAAAAAVAATLLIGAILSTWQAFRATRAEHLAVASQKQESVLRLQAQQQRIRAEQEEALARLNEYVADVNLAHQQLVSAGNYGRAVTLLNKHRPRGGESERRGFEWRYLWQLSRGDEHVVLPTQEGSIRSIAISPSGDLLAVALRNTVNILNVQTRSLITTLPRGGESLAFLPDGTTLVTASFFPPAVHIWNTADWTQQNALSGNSAPIAISRDGHLLATSSRAGVRVWDTASWRQLKLLTNASAMAFSPDSSMLAADTREGLTLWPLNNNDSPKVLADSTNMFGRWFKNDRTLAFSPDGQFIVTPRNALSDRGVFVLSIWDSRSGKELGVMPSSPEYVEHTGGILSLAFSPDGQTLATASSDYSIRLWDFSKRQRVATLQGHLAEVTAVAFSPDGKSIISGAEDGGLKLWATRRPQTEDILPSRLLPLAFSSDSRTLAALSREGAVVFLDLTSRERLQEIPLEKIRFGPFMSVAISRDLGTVAQGLPDGRVKLWNIENGESKILQTPHRQVELVELSPDARILVTGGRSRSLQWWDLQNDTNGPLGSDIHKVLFAPDGRVLAAFQRGNNVQLLKVEAFDAAIQFQPLSELSIDPAIGSSQGSAPQGPFSSASAFSADGRLLAIACQDDVVRVWEVATGKLAGAYSGHKQNVFSVAFSPDGKTLATASEDSTLRFWNIATQQEMLTIRRLGGTLRGLMFSPDGQLLVGASGFVSQSPYGGLRFYHAPVMSDLSAVERNAPPAP